MSTFPRFREVKVHRLSYDTMPLPVINALSQSEPPAGHLKDFPIAKCDATLDKRSHRNLNEKSELYLASGIFTHIRYFTTNGSAVAASGFAACSKSVANIALKVSLISWFCNVCVEQYFNTRTHNYIYVYTLTVRSASCRLRAR